MRAFTMSNSARVNTSGTITSGVTGLPVSAAAWTAASKIARACISAISGKAMASRQPRKPSIGLCSDSSRIRCRIFSSETPVAFTTSATSASVCGRNSWSGGSSRRIVTGSPDMIVNSSRKSWR